ncbi:MAG: GNAT family N-acetyltransferase [Pseudomonadota bacterium]
MTVSADIVKPSQLSETDIARWEELIRAAPHLQRAFLSYDFARACETAYERVYVAVFQESGRVRGFFPFQFESALHETLGSAVHVGERMSDAAGLVAEEGFALSVDDLMRLTRLWQMRMTHLLEDQSAFGLTGEELVDGHLIDLKEGPEAYFEALRAANASFLRDTDRRGRKLEKTFGPQTYAYDTAPDKQSVDDIVQRKRAQYVETGAEDAFAAPRRLALIEALREVRSPFCTPVVSTLAAGQTWVAGHFGLMCLGTLNYWLPVYDKDARKFSPGRLLLWRTISNAAEHGLQRIDRGEGDSQAKRDFSTGRQRFGVAMWRRQGAKGVAARAMTSIAWRLKA